MLSRKRCLLSVTAITLALGGVTMVRAEDKMPDGKDTAALQEKIAEQEKELASFKAHYSDQGFVKIASMANTDEVKAGEAAAEKSKNTDVQEFAQHMVDDHKNVGAQMTALAEKKGWTVHDVVDAKHKLAMEQMTKLTGTDFDKAYVTSQVKDHQEAIVLFQLAADNATDNDLKDFVKSTLPNLKHHLSMAQKLSDKLAATADAR